VLITQHDAKTVAKLKVLVLHGISSNCAGILLIHPIRRLHLACRLHSYPVELRSAFRKGA
jgi:hypothetical protein